MHQHNLASTNTDSYYKNNCKKSAFVNDSNIILRMENLLNNNSTDKQNEKFKENYANFTNNSADRLIVDSK